MWLLQIHLLSPPSVPFIVLCKGPKGHWLSQPIIPIRRFCCRYSGWLWRGAQIIQTHFHLNSCTGLPKLRRTFSLQVHWVSVPTSPPERSPLTPVSRGTFRSPVPRPPYPFNFIFLPLLYYRLKFCYLFVYLVYYLPPTTVKKALRGQGLNLMIQ